MITNTLFTFKKSAGFFHYSLQVRVDICDDLKALASYLFVESTCPNLLEESFL